MAAAVNVGGSSQFVSASEASSGLHAGPPTSYAPPGWAYDNQSPLPPVPGGNDTDYSLLIGHGVAPPSDPLTSPFSLPRQPILTSQQQLLQPHNSQVPPQHFERPSTPPPPLQSGGILATVGSAVGAAVRAMRLRQESVSPRTSALVEETRQLELRAQEAQSASSLAEQRRRDEAYELGIQHRDELRRRLQQLGQQHGPPPGIPDHAAQGDEYGSLSRTHFNANYNIGPPVVQHLPHPQGLNLPPHLHLQGLPQLPPPPAFFGNYIDASRPHPTFCAGGRPNWV
jgi:hypothetical protein